ncbi:MAG: hypothetical protein ACLSAF_08125 [Intestinimonas sp.]
MRGEPRLVTVGDIMVRRTLSPDRRRPGGRTRAMLKVEDGCVNFCTYSRHPYARGPVRSLPLAAAAAEAGRLAGEGYREIVLTGIEISSWGQDFRDGTGFIDLVEAVCAAAPAAGAPGLPGAPHRHGGLLPPVRRPPQPVPPLPPVHAVRLRRARSAG